MFVNSIYVTYLEEDDTKIVFLYLLPVGLKGGSEKFNGPENLFLYLKYFFG